MDHEPNTEVPEGRAGSAPLGARSKPPGLFLTSVWLGLVVGMVELGLLQFQKSLNHVATVGSLQLNQHYLWMTPLSHLTIFALLGALLAGLMRLRPGWGWAIGPKLLAALGCLAILLTFRELSPIASALLAMGLATQGVPRLRRFAPRLRPLIRYSLPVLLAGLVTLFVGRHAQLAWAEREARTRVAPADGSPNVLLIVMDTVRARSLGMYGYGRDTTPRLAALARSGIRFDNARSTAPWTLPSHASMFTGRWPHELFDKPEQRMAEGVPTLAAYLGAKGYATGGFVANTFYCNAGFGLARGFDHYEDFYSVFDTSPTEVLRHSGLGRNLIALCGDEEALRPGGRKDADKINADFLAWLPRANGRPFFAFLNYFDAHAPYFVPEGRGGRHFGRVASTPTEREVLANWQARTNAATPDELELSRDAYDDCISYLDAALGRLFDELDRRGVLDNTLIVVTADHGEELGEHNLLGHGRSLYNEELHVPLIVVQPRKRDSGQIVAEPVSLRDLPSTVADLVGLDAGSPFPGRSLGRFLSSKAPEGSTPSPEPEVVLTEVALRDKVSRNQNRPPAMRGPMKSIVADGMVYIRNSNGDEELYDLAGDPAQATNLAGLADRRKSLERLRDLLEEVNPEDGP